MIYLGTSRVNIDSIAGVWKTELYDFLFKKRKSSCCVVKDGYRMVSKHDTYFKKMKGEVKFLRSTNNISLRDAVQIIKELNYFKTRFATLIMGGEDTLKKEAQDYDCRMSTASESAKKNYQKLMIDLYTAFTHEENDKKTSRSHRFFKKLNIRTCPYCNRLYTFTLDSQSGKAAPQYDHFYDKSDYPLLAVSFYNLIPSCPVCNHIKRTKKTATINPYFQGFESRFLFVDDTDESRLLTKAEVMKRGGGKICLRKADGSESNADKGNISTFALNELYALHNDYVSDIVEKIQMYEGICGDLVSTFQTKAKSPQQVYDFVWGKYLDVAQYENRPLSKLTRDLLDQLGITVPVMKP